MRETSLKFSTKSCSPQRKESLKVVGWRQAFPSKDSRPQLPVRYAEV